MSKCSLYYTGCLRNPLLKQLSLLRGKKYKSLHCCHWLKFVTYKISALYYYSKAEEHLKNTRCSEEFSKSLMFIEHRK